MDKKNAGLILAVVRAMDKIHVDGYRNMKAMCVCMEKLEQIASDLSREYESVETEQEGAMDV